MKNCTCLDVCVFSSLKLIFKQNKNYACNFRYFYTHYFIGVKQRSHDRQWEYLDGYPLIYSNWHSSHPYFSNDLQAVTMHYGFDVWEQESESARTYPSICQYSIGKDSYANYAQCASIYHDLHVCDKKALFFTYSFQCCNHKLILL